MQIIFCLKEENQKKINSHRWFFNAFGQILQPNICVLLDVGTRPGPRSIYHLWNTFVIDSNVGGACGEIVVFKGKYGKKLLNHLGSFASAPPSVYLFYYYLRISGRAKLRIQDVQHPGQISVRQRQPRYRCTLTFPAALGNLCLGISLCFPERSVRTGILRCRTTNMERARYRSISSARHRCVYHLDFVPLPSHPNTMHAARCRCGCLHCKHVPRRGPREYLSLASDFFPILACFAPFSDLVLGAGIKARRVVGPPLCQVGLRRYGYSGSGADPVLNSSS